MLQAEYKTRCVCEKMNAPTMAIFSKTVTLTYDLELVTNSLIDCMVFNAIFNSISVIWQQPVHMSMLS